MKPFVNDLRSALTRLGVTGVLLRLTVLALPWQTRFFVEGPMRGGYAWEQGRWSLYASMIPMFALIASYLLLDGCPLLPTPRRKPGPIGAVPADIGLSRRTLPVRWVASRLAMTRGAGDETFNTSNETKVFLCMLCGCALIAFFFFPTLSFVASLQGFVQVILLLAFGYLAYRNELFRERLPFWAVLSLVPVALFALGQGVFQFVPAFKWLGIALQDPAVRGVSVIEVGTERFLRAYGSFPHPNILGGWMVFATLVSLREWMVRHERWGWLAASILFAAALYASFSRSAWIACVVGGGALAWAAWKKRASKRFALAVILIALPIGGAVALKPELVLTRIASQQRLEVKSVNERAASVTQGLGVIKAYPFGTGFEAYRVGLERACTSSGCVTPAEPPHLVPLLALVELGWIRLAVAVLAIFYASWRVRSLSWKGAEPVFLLPMVVIACLDHYLWSLWAGQGLVVLVLLSIGIFIDNHASERHDRSTEE